VPGCLASTDSFSTLLKLNIFGRIIVGDWRMLMGNSSVLMSSLSEVQFSMLVSCNSSVMMSGLSEVPS